MQVASCKMQVYLVSWTFKLINFLSFLNMKRKGGKSDVIQHMVGVPPAAKCWQGWEGEGGGGEGKNSQKFADICE